MKIKEINEEQILFDNGFKIEYDHYQDCCEVNYADFKQIEPMALNYEFDEDLLFEKVEDSGFRFGNKNGLMFFIPCYSEQNGYYVSDINIYYNNIKVLNLECELLLY